MAPKKKARKEIQAVAAPVVSRNDELMVDMEARMQKIKEHPLLQDIMAERPLTIEQGARMPPTTRKLSGPALGGATSIGAQAIFLAELFGFSYSICLFPEEECCGRCRVQLQEH